MPRLAVASRPWGDAETIFSHRPCVRDVADLTGDLGEILVLAEHHRHVQLPVPCHAHDIEPEPQIDSHFPIDRYLEERAVRQPHTVDPVTEGRGCDADPCSAHFGESSAPIGIPPGGPRRARDSGVEPQFLVDPRVCFADGVGQLEWIVNRVVVAEGVLGTSEEGSGRR